MLPTLLPDMTFYSLCACAHRMSDRSCAADTSAALFGDPRAGLVHDFPYALDTFCVNTAWRYGSVSDIIQNATTLPYFTRFRPNVFAMNLNESLAGQPRGRFKFELGLPACPVGAKFPLRACDQCMHDDTLKYGFPYWHRHHQLPGVWLCNEHSRPLRYSKFRIDRRRRTCYIMPADPNALSATVPISKGVTDEATLLRLSNLSAIILDTALPCEFSSERLRNTYLHGLKSQGLLTRQGRVRAQELIKLLSDRYQKIADVPPFDWLFSNQHIQGLVRLVRHPRSDFHTTYHLLLIDTLFSGWSHFAKVYEWEAAILPSVDDGLCVIRNVAIQPVQDPRAEAAVLRADNEGRSISSVCREIGIDYHTVLRKLAANGGVSVTRRPKVLTEALRSSVVAALGAGMSQQDISKSTGLSRSTVDRVCVETPGLHAVWRSARHNRIRDAERGKMTDYLISHPGEGRYEARNAGNNGFSWLNRHDSAWLKSVIPPKVQNRGHAHRNGSRIDWNARDQECLTAVKAIATRVVFESSDRVMPGTVLRKLPRLSFTPRLNQLPVTKKYIADLIANHKGQGDPTK